MSGLSGAVSETAILRVTSFGGSTRSIPTSSISIVRLQSWRSNSMVVGITIRCGGFVIRNGRSSSLAAGSNCYGFGIIKFARNLIASCKRSGSRSRNIPSCKPSPCPLPCEGRGDPFARMLMARWERIAAHLACALIRLSPTVGRGLR